MKLKLFDDEELYPMWCTAEYCSKEYEVPDELANRFLRVQKEYFEVQEELTRVLKEKK